jgi:hypothetical protein
MIRYRTQRPRKRTDVCDICTRGTALQRRGGGKRASLSQDRQLLALAQHQASAHYQREAFGLVPKLNEMYTCVITIDFKQNLVLPMWKVTPSQCYYSNQQISLLGFVVNFFDGMMHHERVIFYISEVLNHDFFFIRTCLKDVLKLPFMHNMHRIFLFSDNARVFRSAYYFYFLLIQNAGLPQTKWVFLNYFTQDHGKGPCDRFFGLLTKYLETYTLTRDITTFKDLFGALRNWQPSDVLSPVLQYMVKMLRFVFAFPLSFTFLHFSSFS